eukprot:CAMPEP_0180521200 /NCGR_PEP_ID=MMETSP1036_2-20121128/56687_1 /TAXON_ID=632150 /ORGANISM="Azadinium spinosum, Strain 3D9" /LENGTH=91 /DNA_ID=CAMNT_0022533775 /DNA_START=67 /DNA_END=342 /DNA_ORIENTATION=+
MRFVIMLDATFFELMVPRYITVVLRKIKIRAHRLRGDYRSKFKKLMLMITSHWCVALVLPFVYIHHAQGVLPYFSHDVHDHCRAQLLDLFH